MDEVRYWSAVCSRREIQTDMNTGAVDAAAAPTVSLTALLPGRFPERYPVSATANDNIGVAGVQFLLDGWRVQHKSDFALFNFLNTTTATAAFRAHARRGIRPCAGCGGNTPPATVAVTVNNADVTPPTVSLTAPPPELLPEP